METSRFASCDLRSVPDLSIYGLLITGSPLLQFIYIILYSLYLLSFLYSRLLFKWKYQSLTYRHIPQGNCGNDYLLYFCQTVIF